MLLDQIAALRPGVLDRLDPPRSPASDPAGIAPPFGAGAEIPPSDSRMRLSEVIGALSYALDLTEGQPPGHCMRCTWIGMHVGRALALGADCLSDLYYTLLLKDAGCSSNAARLWELYGGDERLIKHDAKTLDTDSVLAIGKFLLHYTGTGEPLRRRVQRLLHVARHGDELADELVQTRCERGANIVRQLGFSEDVAAGVYSLDEHWNGKGRAGKLQGEAIPIHARIALLAQVVDVFHAVGGPPAARAEVRRRSGTWFDPAVVDAFLVASVDDRFWNGLISDGLDQRTAAMEPVARVVRVDADKLDVIAEAFADIVDAKSSFTAGHSRRVTGYSDAIAANLGLGDSHRRWLRRAALLHDIGKLGVSTGILDKPGRLEADEWAAIKRHPVLTEEILSRLSIFRDMAPIAGAHHERLDGKGYPKGLAGDAIPLEARIITAADIFDAVTAQRPYRGPMPVPDAIALMERDREAAIDGRCLDALRAALPRLGLAG